MGKIIETKINKFRSMTPNVRSNIADLFAFSSHFDIFRNGRLSPNRTYTTFTDNSEKVVRFLYARNDEAGTDYSVYGLGDDGSGKPKVFEMTDPAGTAWSAFKTLTGGDKASNVFFEYKNTLYGWQNGDALWSITLTGTPTVDESVATLSESYTNVAQPVHHKADDIAYFFHDNIVSKLDDTTPTTPALTLPTNMKIVGGGAYRNYLAIVCSPIEPGTTNSVMYLWDRDGTKETLSDKIDLGFGEVVHVSEAEDGGIFISQQVVALSGMGNYNNSIAVKYYDGFLQTLEIPFGTETEYLQSITLHGNAAEDRNTFYFPAKIVTSTAQETRNVIFATRRTQQGLTLIADQEVTGVTQNINGIFSLNGHWFISYDTAAKNLVTKSSSLYQTAIYESLIYDAGDSSLKKKLTGVSVMTSPIPNGSTYTLKYRADAETSWTTIFTESTVDTISHSSINIESSGATLPEYKEIQFRIESTGGAEITGFSFMEDILGKRLYMALFEAVLRFGRSLIRK
jgi:hypothetical protein